MPADFDRAVAYVREHGDEFDHARLDELRGEGSPTTHEQDERFFDGQHEDGGWAAFWAPDHSSLDATCYRLAQGETISPYHPAIERALRFLVSRQRPDGSFEEDDAVRDLAPPWVVPGELASRLYLTANCGWSLVNGLVYTELVTRDRSCADAAREAADHAGAYLERHLAPDGSLPSFLHAHWLTVALLIRLNWDRRPELPEPTRRVLDYLATRMSNEVASSSLAWMLTTLGPLGVSPEHPLIQRATALLNGQQRADGSWASEDGPARDPTTTVEALRALVMWQAI